MPPTTAGGRPLDRNAKTQVRLSGFRGAAHTEQPDRLGHTYTPQSWPDAPYHAIWAATAPRLARTVLEGHTGGVTGVCAVEVDGRSLLASAGADGAVRLWDPATATLERTLSAVERVGPSVAATPSI